MRLEVSVDAVGLLAVCWRTTHDRNSMQVLKVRRGMCLEKAECSELCSVTCPAYQGEL